MTTGLAVAIIVSIPLAGGAGTAVGAADQPAGTMAITGSPQSTASPYSGLKKVSAAGVTASTTRTAAATDAASPAPSANAATDSTTAGAGSTSTSAGSSASNASATAQPQAQTPSQMRAQIPTPARINASTQSISRGVSSSSTTTARVAGSGAHPIAHQAAKPAPASVPKAPRAPAATKSCPANVGGSPSGVPGDIVSAEGVQGTTSADLASFALKYNATRVANCLPPIPLQNIRYDSCLQSRLFWIAEDPSTNPASAWGHGVPRSDGKPMVGCDGDIAGGMGDSGATAADKWWESPDHRASLYQPQWGSASYSNVCIGFAISHGGIPNDPAAFSRESARWESCSSFGR